MNWNLFPIIAVLLGFAASRSALRAGEIHREQLINFDKRDGNRTDSTSAEQNDAADVLKRRIAGVRIAWDPVILSPRLIFNENGFLSGPDNEEQLRPKTLAEAAAANANEPRDPYRVIKRFLDENTPLFGHSSEILSVARVSREYFTAHNGLRTVVWEQQLDGIPVFEAVLYGHIAENGELASLSSRFLPAPAPAADAGVPERQRAQEVPAISARHAVALAVADSGEVEVLSKAGVESIFATDRAAKRQKNPA